MGSCPEDSWLDSTAGPLLRVSYIYHLFVSANYSTHTLYRATDGNCLDKQQVLLGLVQNQWRWLCVGSCWSDLYDAPRHRLWISPFMCKPVKSLAKWVWCEHKFLSWMVLAPKKSIYMRMKGQGCPSTFKSLLETPLIRHHLLSWLWTQQIPADVIPALHVLVWLPNTAGNTLFELFPLTSNRQYKLDQACLHF